MYSLYIYIFIVEEKKGEKKDLQTVFTQQHQRQEIKLKNKKKSFTVAMIICKPRPRFLSMILR